MNRIVTSLLGVSFLAITTTSCTKNSQDEMRQQAASQAVAPQVITASVPAGQTYVLNMEAGTTASIQTQALHYQVSEIVTANGSSVYKYTAGKGYSGADQVTLQQSVMSTSGGGCSRNYTNDNATTTLKTVVIKFNVAN